MSSVSIHSCEFYLVFPLSAASSPYARMPEAVAPSPARALSNARIR
jgi:hypothetical protein